MGRGDRRGEPARARSRDEDVALHPFGIAQASASRGASLARSARRDRCHRKETEMPGGMAWFALAREVFEEAEAAK